ARARSPLSAGPINGDRTHVRTSRRIAAAALAAAMIAGLSACAPESSSPSASPDGEPVAGGDATIILGIEAVRGLDPAFLFNLTPSGDANRMSAIYEIGRASCSERV